MTFSTQKMRFWSPEVRELEPYVPGEQPKVTNILKLNTNENPYPPSPQVIEAITTILENQADQLRLYPDSEALSLKQAIAQQQGVDVSEVFVGNGSDEVLAHIFKAFFIQNEPVLSPDISYSFYPVYGQFFQIKTKKIALNENFEVNVKDYVQPNGGIIIANPNAPTSIALELSDIEYLLTHNPDRVVVIDEAYVDFGAMSAVGLVAKYENLMVCQTTSKSRSLAGLRVGFAIAQPHLIAALDAVKNSFNSYPLDRFAIAAATASFKDQAYFETQCQKVIENREALIGQLQALDFHVLPSKANFVFVRHQAIDAKDLASQLREQGIIVRHFNQHRIDQFLRITVGTNQQNMRLVTVLKDIFAHNK
ncbi:histidinol-phosphate transaminase [Acinetobacter sp. B5B]|uniref:histidinol-phosphate transaminase n=1 Tax=Acinetobacter baretiae TaxID=2605383 RepID=UPI0018C2AD1A|nr:histidinol-phosphate transaminase [Acinetobacter baretiae]MBF7683323.1 histidinol-phosphate transaminase [Acinetobacter baretiae]